MTPVQKKYLFKLWAMRRPNVKNISDIQTEFTKLKNEYGYKNLQELIVLMAKDGITKQEIMEVIG